MTELILQDFDRKQHTVGITAGSFDVFHAGHVLAFREAKKRVDKLIVFLQTNPSIDRSETKNKPVQSIVERQIQILACKYVDAIMIYETEEELVELLTVIDYDTRFIGSDWKEKPFTGHDIPGHFDKCVFTDRNHNWSTSFLRKRICDNEAEMVKTTSENMD